MRKINMDLLDGYAQAIVDSMDEDDVRAEVREIIYARLLNDPWVDVVTEIDSGEHAHLLDKYGVSRDE